MSKKKAIKITTATAIAASAFVAVAPTQSEAATSSVDKAITKATNQMAKAYDTYHKTAKNEGKLPATGTIRNEVKLAKDYYAAAEKEISKNGGSKTKKAAYTKTLNAKKYFLDRAEAYLAAINTNLNPAKTALTAAVETGKAKNVGPAKAALVKDVEAFEATVAKIYGPDVRDLLLEKYATPATDLSNSVNDELKVYDAYKKIEAGKFADLEETAKLIDSVKAEVETLKGKDTKLAKTLVEVVAKNIKAFEEAQVPTVKDVSAINSNKVKITFNKEVKDITASDVTLTEPVSGTKLYVKSVKPSADNKSLEVDLYDTLVSGKTYDVDVKAGKDVASGQLAFTLGEAAQIVVEDQVVSTSSKALDYKVLDANGVDITDLTTVAVESNSNAIDASKGAVTVNLANNQYAFVELKVAKKDGTVVSSKRVKVTAQAPAAASFGTNWTLYNGSVPTEASYKADNYKQDSTLNLGSSKVLDAELVDQFGDRFPTESSVKFTSLDTSVAIVDEVTGKVTPRKEGKAVVKATIYDGSTAVASKVFELNVVGQAKLTGITTDKSVVNAVTTAGLTESLGVKLVDQFGNVIGGALTAESADPTVATVTGDADTDGNVSLVITGHKAGTTSIKLTAGNFTKTVVVNVSEAGAVADYKVDGVKSELLVKDVASTTDTDETTMTFNVKAVDTAGRTKEIVTNPTVTVKDKNGVEQVAKASVDGNGTVTITGLSTDVDNGPFSLQVKVGSLAVLNTTFKVTDNRVAPSYQVKTNKVTVNAGNAASFNDLFDGTVLDFGTTNVTVSDVDFVSSNEAVINDADTTGHQGVITTGDGSASVYVDTVTLTTDDGDIFVVDLKGLKVDVAVDKTVPVFAATYPKATASAIAGSKAGTLAVKAGETGTAHILVQAAAATPPSVATVLASTNTLAVTKDTEATKALTFDANASDYKVYVVVEDAAGNASLLGTDTVTSPAAPVTP